jgi:hypothetical protein
MITRFLYIVYIHIKPQIFEGKHETEETSVTQNSSTKNVGNSEDQIPTADQVSVNETENKHGRNSSVDQFVIPKRKICESGIIIFCLCLFDGGCGASLNNFMAGVIKKQILIMNKKVLGPFKIYNFSKIKKN